MSRRGVRLVAAFVVALTWVVCAAGPALADPPIPLGDDNKGSGGATGSPGSVFSLTTDGPYWSAVVVLNGASGGSSVDYDMSIADNSGNLLARSAYGASVMDFVAIDSNLRAPGPYLLTVSRYNFSGSSYWFDIWFRQQNLILGPAAGAPVNTLDEQWVMIRDVYLNAGDCLAVNAWRFGQSTGQMLVMASNPNKPVQGRGDAVAAVSYQPTDTGTKTLRYTATRAGWYGFVISNMPTGIPDSNTTVQYQRTTC
jgi:hypothetical protein